MAISTYARRRSSGVGGYYAPNSSIPWGVNGIAFAGGYLSVASFLGICGLIAFFGYDGFLYSIGFLAGWIIALFIIAEPMKRMGTYTFSDALNRNFKSPGIQLAAGLSVLVVSLFYLVPQMVGAGVLIEPLLGIPHYWGVIIIGSVVILIVAGGGMTSTSYVQFFNGGLLLTFAGILTAAVLMRGVNVSGNRTEEGTAGLENYRYQSVTLMAGDGNFQPDLPGARVLDRFAQADRYTGEETLVFYQISHLVPAIAEGDGDYTAFVKGRTPYFHADFGHGNGWDVEEIDGDLFLRIEDWWWLATDDQGLQRLVETQYRAVLPNGGVLVNGAPECPANRLRQMGGVAQLPARYGQSSGPVDPLSLLRIFFRPA